MASLFLGILKWILAASPIIVVLVLMIGFKWGGSKAGAGGWVTALVVSPVFFGAGLDVFVVSQLRGLLLSLYVLYVIWMALVLYNVVVDAGAISVIGRAISHLTGDRVLQLLILGWVFSSFLQGIAGYGVPIAVVAPLLIGLGFSPITSVAAVAAGHSWAVTFGSIAASFNTLIAASGLPGEALAASCALLLGFACFMCGIAAAYAYEGWKSVRRGAPAVLFLGSLMAVTQYVTAVSGLWNVAAFVAGLVGLAACVLLVRIPFYRKCEDSAVLVEAQPAAGPNPGGLMGITGGAGPVPARPLANPGPQPMGLLLAVTPYALLVLVVSAAELVPDIHKVLNTVRIEMMFPATQTALGWVQKAGKGQSISVFGHAGALLAISSIAAYVLYTVTGHYKPGAAGRIWSKTRRSALNSSIGIIAMVGFATLMEQSGMTGTIAVGLSAALKPVFPFVAPFIGLLGAFMTGSNTNSNAIFTVLQQQTAELLGLPVAAILAAQTTGGALGGMLAPARIIVGCSTAGLSGKEGYVLQRTIVYGLIMTVATGLVALLIAR